MKPEDIERLRQDFADLLSESAGVEETIPDAWLPSVRFTLSQLRRVRDGVLYVDADAVELVVRAVKIVQRRYTLRHRPTLGLEVVAPAARGRTHQAILSVLSAAHHSVEAAEKEDLGRERTADIERDVARYVRKCLTGRRIVEYRHVVYSCVDDPEWTQAAYVDLVVSGVRSFAKGGAVAGLDEADRSHFLAIHNAER
ncbi:hypothetical protein [Rhizobium sp. Leaf383]|uniref:hypothetical protein n=1 Tax=Rhizobium sp. Leaf383 TaxID=1736357 RepID=UPI000712631D|nr:hypothetical protein [Rhizobium sp. Leaf383]KQS84850.1 hypothetical protein ASG58_20370 [Rhizobium sp. Leaf383]